MTDLSNGRHGKLDRKVAHGVQQLILVIKRLVLLVRRPAVFRDKGVHIGCIGEEVIGSLSTCNDRLWSCAVRMPRVLELSTTFGGCREA